MNLMEGFTKGTTRIEDVINYLWVLGKFFLIATAFSSINWVLNFPFEFSFDLGFVQATGIVFLLSMLCFSLSAGIYAYWYHYFGGKQIEDSRELQEATK